MVINFEVFVVFLVLLFHPNSNIAHDASLSDEIKSLENTLKKLYQVIFNRYFRTFLNKL